MIDLLRPDFEAIGAPLPEKIRVSCGFPSKSALANKARRIGECWGVESSEDKSFQVFVSPLLKESVEVTATLVHELVHTAVGSSASTVASSRRSPRPSAWKAK